MCFNDKFELVLYGKWLARRYESLIFHLTLYDCHLKLNYQRDSCEDRLKANHFPGILSWSRYWNLKWFYKICLRCETLQTNHNICLEPRLHIPHHVTWKPGCILEITFLHSLKLTFNKKLSNLTLMLLLPVVKSICCLFKVSNQNSLIQLLV